jgi:hypothetical protein
MPWDSVKLNDGKHSFILLELQADYLYRMQKGIKSLALRTFRGSRAFSKAPISIRFGTWTLGKGQGPIDQVEQALSTGFSHIGL